MSGKDKYLNLLHQYWGYADFRGIQRDIIESIGAKRDTLGLMPTGGGKSITFQIPALAQEGVCIVVTPLIALMKDQVYHLRQKGIPSYAIYSGMSNKEILTVLDNCILGDIKLLYISPERIHSDLFLSKLKRIKVSFITIDEAHCISQWGYDFRPAYLHIAHIRKEKPNVPVLALTATATKNVITDIQEKLNFAQQNVYSMSFVRENLAYVVRTSQDKENELVHILNSVAGSSIVYVRNRKRTKEIATMLNQQGIAATYYHAGLEPTEKDERQTQWQTDNIRVMVATNAFGMGIDKPDVRVVAHIDCPDSIEAYFQEAGRAGRDGQTSYAVLLYNGNDERKLQKRVADNFPEKDYIVKVYEYLAYFFELGMGSGQGHTFTFDIDKFCRIFKFFPIQVDAALTLLARSGYIEYETDPDANARLMFLLDRHELYKLNHLSPNEDKVITILLRNYGGLFADYCYINEALIAQQTALQREQVYLILKTLTQRRILHFIPQQKIPYITYLTNRIDPEKIKIPANVYEERKQQFTQRIQSIISYTQNNGVCRSTQLLRYFGEKQANDCGKCDVCLAQKTEANTQNTSLSALQRIEQLLSDKQKHHITQLQSLGIANTQLDQLLDTLIKEERIGLEDCYIFAIN